MYRIALIALAILSTPALAKAADDSQWKLFNFSKTTPGMVVMLFGPPSIIKTEEKYSDWIKNQAQGCGQIHIYVSIEKRLQRTWISVRNGQYPSK